MGPAERPCTDGGRIRSGSAEFVFQEPAGRRLADRVVDVIQICRLALETDDIEGIEIQGPHGLASGTDCNDELLIADQLLARRIMPPSPRPDRQ